MLSPFYGITVSYGYVESSCATPWDHDDTISTMEALAVHDMVMFMTCINWVVTITYDNRRVYKDF